MEIVPKYKQFSEVAFGDQIQTIVSSERKFVDKHLFNTQVEKLN